MTIKPLNILKNGLSEIKKTIQVQKDELDGKLAQKETRIASLDGILRKHLMKKFITPLWTQ
jgi:hypothetical protein